MQPSKSMRDKGSVKKESKKRDRRREDGWMRKKSKSRGENRAETRENRRRGFAITRILSMELMPCSNMARKPQHAPLASAWVSSMVGR